MGHGYHQKPDCLLLSTSFLRNIIAREREEWNAFFLHV